MWRKMEPTHESSCWPTTTRNDVPTTPHTQSATKKISIYNSTMLYIEVNCMVHPKYLFCIVNVYIFSKNISHGKEKRRAYPSLSPPDTPLFLHQFHVHTQTISRPSKSMHAPDTFTRDSHCISCESTILSLDFRICSLRSSYTFSW